MKRCLFPTLVLLVLLGLALWNAAAIRHETQVWCGQLDTLCRCAESGDRYGADAALQTVRTAWDRRQPYFHVVLVHGDLDEAEELLAEAEARLSDTLDAAELRVCVARLKQQLMLLSETQALSIKNIL